MSKCAAIALAIAVASCANGEDRCRALTHLEEGYHRVPLALSWSGVTMDQPNFTRPGCDLPLAGVITSRDTVNMLATRLQNEKLREGRSSFESKVDAFLYVSSNKTFIVGLDFAEN